MDKWLLTGLLEQHLLELIHIYSPAVRHLSKSAGQAFKRIGNAVSHVSKSGIRSVAREVLKAGRYYYSQIATQAIRSGRAAIAPIITSNIPSAVYNFIGALRAS